MLGGAIGKVKGWLFHQEPEEPRRALRSQEPEILVHYWDGSAPEGRHLRDISETGAYIYTKESWYPGTIVRLILQGYQKKSLEDGTTVPAASACVPARVVRQGVDGVAVEFAFRNKEEEETLRKFLAAIPAQPVQTVSPK